MTRNELSYALFGLEIKIPYRLPPGNIPVHYFNPAEDEATWDAYQWNPPQGYGYDEPDPEADPKPTWEDLQRGLRLYHIGEHIQLHDRGRQISSSKREGSLSEKVEDARDRALASHEHTLDETATAVHVGDGLVHMPALLGMSARTAIAGHLMPRVVLRKSDDHNPVSIWLHRHLDGFLGGLVHRTNLVESARNLIRNRAEDLRATLIDANGGLAETASEDEKLTAREAAHTALQALLEPDNLDTLIAQHAADLDKAQALPDDVPTAREVLFARLSAATNRRRNEVLAVVEAQDAFLPASCVEQERALAEIAGIRQKALIAMKNVDTVATMLTIQALTLASLEAVRVLNTPIWTTTAGVPLVLNGDGEFVGGFLFDADTNPQDVVTIRATNPPQSDLTGGRTVAELGSVAVVGFEQDTLGEPWSGEIWPLPLTVGISDTVREVPLKYTGSIAPPASSLVKVTARNNCGPSTLKIRIDLVTPASE